MHLATYSYNTSKGDAHFPTYLQYVVACTCSICIVEIIFGVCILQILTPKHTSCSHSHSGYCAAQEFEMSTLQSAEPYL